MIRTSLIPFLLLILVCTSCNTSKNSKFNLEGTWIESYSQFFQKDSFHTSSFSLENKFFLKFKDNKARLIKFKITDNGEAIDTIVNFKWKDDTIILGDHPISKPEIAVTKDSLVMTINGVQTHRYILKKLSKTSKRVSWNPTKKKYKVLHEDYRAYFHFMNDSIVHSYAEGRSKLDKNNWKIVHIDNHSILISGSDLSYFTYELIDSLVGNNVYLTNYSLGKMKYAYEEHSISRVKPTTLVGTWKLVAKEDVKDSTHHEDGLSLNNLQKLQIQKDSITFFKAPFKYKDQWKYDGNGKVIVFDKQERVAKVVKLSKDSLVLDMDLSEYGSHNRKFTFTRE